MAYVTSRGRSLSRLVTYVRRRVSRLGLFMALVMVVGIPIAAWLIAELPRARWTYDHKALIILVLALVIGELMPIEVARQGRHSDEITISSTVALALAFVAPLGCAVVAQAIPLVIDDIRRGKSWTRPLFNVAQYSLTFAASRFVFCLLSGQAFLEPETFRADYLTAAFAAAATFFVVNHTLVGTAVALWSEEPIAAHLRDDVRFQMGTSGLLVCLAPVVVGISAFSVILIPVLLLPIAAVRNSARLAIQRHNDALHDALTGLPNRALLQVELLRALSEAERTGEGLAVMFIDLDHFKEINDTLGHHVGDSLIVEVAARVSRAAGEGITVSRLGGDEFAVLAPVHGDDAERHRQAVAVVEALASSLSEPVTLAGVRLEVRASIGIALAPEHANNSDELLARADVAMYLAKKQDGAWAIYDPRQDQHTPQRLTLLTEMRDGLERGEFVLHYQPQCDIRSGEIIGAEALVRWQHPTLGLLAPDQFIPLAETTELIAKLTFVVLEQAIREARSWLNAGRWIGIAVNLSVRHLTDTRLPEHTKELLERYQLPPSLLTLEVTESTVMNDPRRAASVLAALRGYGIRIAVDDYGTGYSSLAYLKRLAIDELKIDKSFIGGMTTDENDQMIVRSTIDLGHNLRLQLVAEGVEDLDTWRALEELGCDVMQGYILSRPLPAPEFTQWLNNWAQQRDHMMQSDTGQSSLPLVMAAPQPI
jgi:diguanylate cyclase (GGDEF)-like protein